MSELFNSEAHSASNLRGGRQTREGVLVSVLGNILLVPFTVPVLGGRRGRKGPFSCTGSEHSSSVFFLRPAPEQSLGPCLVVFYSVDLQRFGGSNLGFKVFQPQQGTPDCSFCLPGKVLQAVGIRNASRR